VGFGESGCRVIELRQRQRRAQFKTACALALRDGDSRLESCFGGRGVGGVALEQDFAAGPVEFRFERAVAEPIGRRQRFIEDRNGANAIARPGFGVGQRDLVEPVEI
jgi:hypothetical protein